MIYNKKVFMKANHRFFNMLYYVDVILNSSGVSI